MFFFIKHYLTICLFLGGCGLRNEDCFKELNYFDTEGG